MKPRAVELSERDPDAVASGDGAGSRHSEWLLTDGRGGYGCGTAEDLPTRRYHSWLTCVPAGQSRRIRFLGGVDERVGVGAAEQPWSLAQWDGQAAVDDHHLQSSFEADPVPTLIRRAGDAELTRELLMPPGQQAVVARWRNTGSVTMQLSVRPLLDWVDADVLGRERAIATDVRRDGSAVGFCPDSDFPPLWVTWSGDATFDERSCWYRNYKLTEEAARGYDSVADRWAPGVLRFELPPGAAQTVAFALAQPVTAPLAAFEVAYAECRRRRVWAESADSPLAARLRRGVEDFFFRDESGRLGVLAGFPWFGEWGRDSFIALPGLTLSVGQPDRCAEVLTAALPFLRQGLMPNVFGRDARDSHYDSADAALWFALAVQRWQDAGVDAAEVRDRFGAALRSIAESYLDGTELGLRTDEEGLLCAGSKDRNATWMDARIGEQPVTPRNGQPVEIVGLWCALLEHLGELFGKPWRKLARTTGKAFVERFWHEATNSLVDCRDDGVACRSVRPNMLLAAALPRSPLTRKQRRGVVEAAQELVTPRGLRTLAPSDDAYRGNYGGDQQSRDLAYHQGTVWPWLAGFYVEASLASVGRSRRASLRQSLLEWLHGFLPEVDRSGLGHISEVFDGDPPHAPGGTFAQAWSTAEMLRALQLCDGGYA